MRIEGTVFPVLDATQVGALWHADVMLTISKSDNGKEVEKN
jgi:hypothetical protein